MSGPVEALVRRLALALDDLKPDLPGNLKASIVVVRPDDPNITIVVGDVDAEDLLDRLARLACDDSKRVGRTSMLEADLRPAEPRSLS